MTNVKVEIRGHYEVREVPYGKDYKWVPTHALIECDCGQVLDADAHSTTCPGCGRDHTEVIERVIGRHLSDEVLHPWHPEHEAWVRHRKDHPERDEWLEERALE